MARTGERGEPPSVTGQADIPRDFPTVPTPPPTPTLDSFTLKEVMDLQKRVVDVGAKTGRLIKDVEGHSEKIDAVRHQITFVKGALWVIGFLFLAIGSLITLYLTGKISVSVK